MLTICWLDYSQQNRYQPKELASYSTRHKRLLVGGVGYETQEGIDWPTCKGVPYTNQLDNKISCHRKDNWCRVRKRGMIFLPGVGRPLSKSCLRRGIKRIICITKSVTIAKQNGREFSEGSSAADLQAIRNRYWSASLKNLGNINDESTTMCCNNNNDW